MQNLNVGTMAVMGDSFLHSVTFYDIREKKAVPLQKLGVLIAVPSSRGRLLVMVICLEVNAKVYLTLVQMTPKMLMVYHEKSSSLGQSISNNGIDVRVLD